MKKLITLFSNINSFEFEADDKLTGGSYSGKGKLKVTQDESIFEIIGTGNWIDNNNNSTSFNFSYRIKLFEAKSEISIEHMRYGIESPTYLCNLKLSGEKEYVSIQPHICGNDYYEAILIYSMDSVQLSWKITGPNKNILLNYTFQ